MSVCLSVQLSDIGVELGFILDDLLSSDLNKLYVKWHVLSVCLSVCMQLSDIGVELGFILDDLLSSDLNKLYVKWHVLSVCLSVCMQLSDIGVELGFILDDLLSSDLNKLIQQAGDNQMDAVRHRAAVSATRLSVCLSVCQCIGGSL